MLPAGTILVAASGTLGYTQILGVQGCAHDGWLILTSLRNFDRDYAYYVLQQMQGHFYNSAYGAAIQNINTEILRETEIPYPSLSTQCKIASILSAYDDLIENNQRRIKILEEMVQNLYREWFVKFRFPGHEKVKFVDSPLGRIPEGWEVTNISATTKYINRGIAPKYNESSTSLVINQKCIRDGKLNIALARRHKSRVANEKYIIFGDILINSTGVGTLGRVTQVYEKYDDITVDTHVSIVRPSIEIDIDFLGIALLELEPYFSTLGAGATGQTELRRDRIGETGIIMPPEDMRSYFAKKVSPLRMLSGCIVKKNNVLRRTRDLLLPKLISGEIDVSDLDIAVPEEVEA